MIDYEKEFGRPDYQYSGRGTFALASIYKVVYGWMTAGLALSGFVAWFTLRSGLYETIVTGPGMIVCVIAEFALVIGLSMAINKLPAVIAALMFLAYAAVNGLTLSVIFLAYEIALVERVFFITAGMFGGLALWGTFTKSDLSSIGSVCGMALWGLIIAGLVNVFLRSSGLDFICSFVGILVFSGLTMYDARKVKAMAEAQGTMDAAAVQKVGILGALQLYLDFINLFLHILRFMGRKR